MMINYLYVLNVLLLADTDIQILTSKFKSSNIDRHFKKKE